ncbi:hypothetical protein HPB48_012044 [Haemaphysalis longicornis]|uniref:Uncharacterized protein n=1 Tax=Haemaphysalis longicornis TaxID=44386 RepID=A0A9J6FUD0_HAELO|nr:hypothetical protein HPB48_012044 [Haemaphysalis longicornis]
MKPPKFGNCELQGSLECCALTLTDLKLAFQEAGAQTTKLQELKQELDGLVSAEVECKDVFDHVYEVPSDCFIYCLEGFMCRKLLRNMFCLVCREGLVEESEVHKQPEGALVLCKTRGSMIDLRKECFRPEKKNYERVRQSLERCGELVANVAVCWEPPEEPPSLPALSAKSHFSHAGYNVVTCKPRHRSSVEFTQSTPAALETLDLEEEDLLPVHEWLGAVVCGIASRDPENLDDEFVSRYHCPQPSTEVSRLLVADWRGFFTPACVVHLVSLLRQCMVGEEWPFFCLVLHRFDDDPTQPCDKHRSLLLGRSSELSIVCAANGRYCLFRSPK